MRLKESWGGTRVAVSPVAWVEAAPFRAHVQWLMACGGLSVEEFAEVAMVSRRAVRRLVYGRDDGRVVQRICPYVARRLLRVRPVDVRDLDHQVVPSAVVMDPLVDLLRVEGRIDVLAREIGLEAAQLWAIIYGSSQCSRLVAVRIRVAAEELMARQFAARPSPAVVETEPLAEVVALPLRMPLERAA